MKKKRIFKRGEKKMTENAIKYQSLKEDARHNRETEGQRRKEFDFEKKRAIQKGIGDTIKNASNIGALLKGAASFIGAQDKSWYDKNPYLVKDTASLSYNNPLGAKVPDIGSNDSVPGVMVLEFQPTIGDTKAINSAAKNIYSYVRFANSGSKNYEPNDLIAYLLQMGDIYSYHAFCAKVYSLLNDMKAHNYYYYKTMLHALHVDADDLREHIADFRAFINSYATRANALNVPNGLPLFTRRYWMHSVIAKDAPIKKSQEYMFNQAWYWVYDDTNSKLVPTKLYDINTSNLLTYNQIRAFGEALLDTVLSSSDIGIMSGDILKAYGEAKMHKLAMLDSTYHIESVYNPEILSQIQNATIIGMPKDGNTSAAGTGTVVTAADVYKDIFTVWCPAGGDIKQGVAYTGLGNPEQFIIAPQWCESESYSNRVDFGDNVALVMYKDDPDAGDNMVATRLTAHVDSPSSSQTVFARTNNGTFTSYYLNTNTNSALGYRKVDAVGTEVIIDTVVYEYDSDTQTETATRMYVTPFGVLGNATELPYAIRRLCLLSKFEFAPMLVVVNKSSHTVLGTSKEFKNYASVSSQVLRNMNYTAVLSLYGVPLIGGTK